MSAKYKQIRCVGVILKSTSSNMSKHQMLPFKFINDLDVK